ncbi:MAG: hypothetical protein GX478_04540 [Erysipelotrichaceae bacterium]|nr:hypothetical protein [Erysipelotrichaceae bacterium]
MMKKKNEGRKPWLQSFEKKWQRALIMILCMLFIACMTISVLFGIDLLLSGSQTADSASDTSSASGDALPTEVQTVLPLSSDGGRSYLDSTLFLGDSNTVRFMSFNDEDGKTYTSTQNTIAVVGMGIQAIDTLECEQLSSGTFTMTDAVPILQPERIIITFGTNNLDGKTTDPTSFITEYAKQLKKIQEAYPSADLIVNSIPPIASANDYPKVTIAQIELYNQAVMEMCGQNHWKYLNSYETLIDENTKYAKLGYMANDGLHLSETGLRALFTYIRTHAYITVDDRPQPLQAIPEIIGPLTTLYTVNPLNNQSFDAQVLNPSSQETSQAAASAAASAPAASETSCPAPASEAPAEQTAVPTASSVPAAAPAPTADTSSTKEKQQ